LSLSTRLINDESPACREKIATTIEVLIKQVSSEACMQLYEITVMLLKDKKLIHREMAAQIVVRFVNICDKDFLLPKFSNLLHLLTNSIAHNVDEPGKFVRSSRMVGEREQHDSENGEIFDDRDAQIIEDHHLIQTLNAIIKILEYDNCRAMRDENNSFTIDSIGYKAHSLLSHDHTWVRLRSLKIIKLIIASLDVKKAREILMNDTCVEVDSNLGDAIPFLQSKKLFQNVAFDIVVQLKPDADEEHIQALLDVLLELANVLKEIPIKGKVDDKKDFNLMWLIRRMRYAIHSEVAIAPSSCLLRKSIFQFFNKLIDAIDVKLVHKLSGYLLTPILREIVEGEHTIKELKNVATEVSNCIKNIIGMQNYDKHRLSLQHKMLRKRVNRRKEERLEKINNPTKAASKTIRKHLKKNVNKKKRKQDFKDGIILPKKKAKTFN
jgi:U3 small nucleolar RNA-associated protein 20